MRITENQLRTIINQEIRRSFRQRGLQEGLWDDIKGTFGGKKSGGKTKAMGSIPKGAGGSARKEQFLNVMFDKSLKALEGTLADIGPAIGDARAASFIKAIKILRDDAKPVSEFLDQVGKGTAKVSDIVSQDMFEKVTEAFATLRNLKVELSKLQREIEGSEGGLRKESRARLSGGKSKA